MHTTAQISKKAEQKEVTPAYPKIRWRLSNKEKFINTLKHKIRDNTQVINSPNM